MDPTMHEWFSLVFRWAHVIAAITWIGHALFFNWLDASLEKSDKDGVEGDLWMVHSGGFYQVEKLPRVPAQLLARMHWFKWEAAFTWLTGFMVLGLVYHMGGGALMIDTSVADLSAREAAGIGIGSMVVGWVVYDLLWISPLANQPKLASAISFALLIALAWGLSQLLSGRAAFMHVGATMGTIMVANVWMRIIPAQKAMVAATVDGKPLDHRLAVRAKNRSVHNNYMTYPLIFIMISNHYFLTFGASRAWLLLALIMVAGGGVRHIMNLRGGFSVAAAIAVVAAGGAAIYLSLPKTQSKTSRPKPAVTAPGGAALQPIDPATSGSIRGVVKFDGAVPERRELHLVSGCIEQHDGPVYVDDVVTEGGKLANVFVTIESGFESWQLPDPPADAVTIDQAGCLYRPRVVGVQAGQPVAFLNSDPLLHNVHAHAEVNSGFNQAMASKGMRMEKMFYDPEIMVNMKCDVHPWMSAFIGVVPHPWHAVSDAAGAFEMTGVPPGEYVVRAWHEVFGDKTQTVTVPASGAAELTFAYTP